ncbi:MAG: hypothetical protein M1825_000836 [Sarcosagium campestre]|nr:MAG: hypothetical protein M1825_000836 [Sarcosagium campestre]
MSAFSLASSWYDTLNYWPRRPTFGASVLGTLNWVPTSYELSSSAGSRNAASKVEHSHPRGSRRLTLERRVSSSQVVRLECNRERRSATGGPCNQRRFYSTTSIQQPSHDGNKAGPKDASAHRPLRSSIAVVKSPPNPQPTSPLRIRRVRARKMSSSWTDAVKTWSAVEAEFLRAISSTARARKNLTDKDLVYLKSALMPQNKKSWPAFWQSQSRPRFVYLQAIPGSTGVERFSRHWTKGFARIYNKINDSPSEERLPAGKEAAVALHLNRQSLVRAKSLLSSGPWVKGLAAFWSSFLPFHRRANWPSTMLRVLNISPEHALSVLIATYTTPFPPSYAVADSFQLVCKYHLKNGPAPDPAIIRALLAAIPVLLHANPERPVRLHQNGIFALLQHTDSDQTARLYDHMTKDRPGHDLLHENTKLQFINRFAQLRCPEDARRVLRDVLANSADGESSAKILNACNSVLDLGKDADGERSFIVDVLKEMSAKNVKPNSATTTVAIRASLSGPNPDAVGKVYEMGSRSPLVPDKYLYSMLLNHAKGRRDRQAVKDVLESLGKSVGSGNDHIETDILHAVFLFTQARTAPTAFRAVLARYRKFYSIQPLVDLGIVPPSTRDDTDLRHPPAVTVNVVLSCFLCHCRRMSVDAGVVASMYTRFLALVTAGHPTCTELAENDFVFNAFAQTFGMWQKTLPACEQVISDMRAYAAPTVRTWTILIQAYLRHGQANRVNDALASMEASKLRPNYVTWNVLLNGYQRLGDFEKADWAFEMMQDEMSKWGDASLLLEDPHRRSDSATMEMSTRSDGGRIEASDWQAF